MVPEYARAEVGTSGSSPALRHTFNRESSHEQSVVTRGEESGSGRGRGAHDQQLLGGLFSARSVEE